MKKFTHPLLEASLVVALVGLFAVPIFVFGSFSPKIKEEVVYIESEEQRVLGVTSYTNFQIELLPTTSGGFQVEELHNTTNKYTANVYLGRTETAINQGLVKVQNTDEKELKMAVEISGLLGLSSHDELFIKIGNARFDVRELDGDDSLSTLITLEPNEYSNLVLLTEEPIDATATFVIDLIPVQ